MYGAVWKSSKKSLRSRKVQGKHVAENSDCFQTKLHASGPELFMKYFRALHQNNKTEIMLDNDNQMHRHKKKKKNFEFTSFFMLFHISSLHRGVYRDEFTWKATTTTLSSTTITTTNKKILGAEIQTETSR